MYKMEEERSFTNSTSLVTMYIPGKTILNDITSMLNFEVSQTQNIKSKHTRNGVKDSLNAILTYLRTLKRFPDNGLCIFSGETMNGFMRRFIEPKYPVDRFIYTCDTKFHV